jgi:hypothetical protein
MKIVVTFGFMLGCMAVLVSEVIALNVLLLKGY